MMKKKTQLTFLVCLFCIIAAFSAMCTDTTPPGDNGETTATPTITVETPANIQETQTNDVEDEQTPLDTPTETTQQTPLDTQTETTQQTNSDTQTETTQQTNSETPTETTQQTNSETPTETTQQTNSETPTETTQQTTVVSPAPYMEIVSPVDGESVQETALVKGNAQGFDESNQSVYVLVKPITSDSVWWVQSPVDINSNGEWTLDANIGDENTEPGTEFVISAIISTMELEENEQLDQIPENVADFEIVVERE